MRRRSGRSSRSGVTDRALAIGEAISDSPAMERARAIDVLQAHEGDLRKLGVKRLFLFGSTARDAATDTSDVDLFFDYERGTFGLFELMEVKAYAASILGHPTDIMTRDSLHQVMRQEIEQETLRVF